VVRITCDLRGEEFMLYIDTECYISAAVAHQEELKMATGLLKASSNSRLLGVFFKLFVMLLILFT
jgi:hypothetical protein